MGRVVKILPLELEEVASGYAYDHDLFRDFDLKIWTLMRDYADGYGQTMIEHLSRTSSSLANYMAHTGQYNSTVVSNIAHAFKHHDLGKTAQCASLWNLPEKPSAAVREERKNHIIFGEVVLEDILDEPRFRHLDGHPHISVMECMMRHHHERINGKGPLGMSGDSLGRLVETVGIIDGADGKMIPRAAIRSRTIGEVFREMTGSPLYTKDPKHQGEFRESLLRDVGNFFQKDTAEWIFPGPVPGMQTLAFA